mgnify:CR=1 FL=1
MLAGVGVALCVTGAPASRTLTAAYHDDPSLPFEATEDKPITEEPFVTQRVVFAST